MKVHTYKDLTVWEKAVTLTLEIYKLTRVFPKEEQYGLISQMRRAAVSIPSNIAEGKLRNSEREFRQFLLIAFGSGGELETQVEIAKRLGLGVKEDSILVKLLLGEVMRMLNSLIIKLAPKV